MRALPALLACLLLTAGCSGVVPSAGDPSETPSPTATAVPVPTEADGELAPGVTRAGIENVSDLLAAHNESIANRSLVVATGVEYPEGGPGDSRAVAHIAPGRERFFFTRDDRPGGSLEGYGDAEAVFIRNRFDNRTRYSRIDPLRMKPNDLPRFSVGAVLRTLDTERVTRTDGSVRIEGHPAGPIGYTQTPTRPDQVNVTVHVEPSGRLRYIGIRYPVAHDGEMVPTVQYTHFLDVGTTTVAEPNWLPAAREATDNGTDAAPRTHTATP